MKSVAKQIEIRMALLKNGCIGNTLKEQVDDALWNKVDLELDKMFLPLYNQTRKEFK